MNILGAVLIAAGVFIIGSGIFTIGLVSEFGGGVGETALLIGVCAVGVLVAGSGVYLLRLESPRDVFRPPGER